MCEARFALAEGTRMVKTARPGRTVTMKDEKIS